jgi:predicted nucleic acid-binding protein
LKTYADTSFLVRLYLTQSDSQKALAFMRDFRDPLPFTPLHRHELRDALRLAVFRKEIDAERRKAVFLDIESDLQDGILTHTRPSRGPTLSAKPSNWERITRKQGVRSVDLLHVGIAQALGMKQFLTFDARQAELAKAAGLKVKF